jgi:hypothetical protein
VLEKSSADKDPKASRAIHAVAQRRVSFIIEFTFSLLVFLSPKALSSLEAGWRYSSFFIENPIKKFNAQNDAHLTIFLDHGTFPLRRRINHLESPP